MNPLKINTMEQVSNQTYINSLPRLVDAIQRTNQFFLNQVQKQINTSLTLRNWIIGFYIVEYEHRGQDRAEYGEKLYNRIANRLSERMPGSIRERHLYLCKDFYFAYPRILRTVSAKLYLSGFQDDRFFQTSFAKSIAGEQDKRAVMQEKVKIKDTKPEDILKNPYILEFLGLDEKPSYTETDLEASIITHLQTILLEMGRGFCFEARQKRITFDNTHYRIDLVFYHRILKCHVLLELKMDGFTHADAGQINVYLNYYKENEMQVDDNPPIGIILCAGKDEALVKYATMGLPQKVFVSKYLINLPAESDLQKIINEEREKLKP